MGVDWKTQAGERSTEGRENCFHLRLQIRVLKASLTHGHQTSSVGMSRHMGWHVQLATAGGAPLTTPPCGISDCLLLMWLACVLAGRMLKGTSCVAFSDNTSSHTLPRPHFPRSPTRCLLAEPQSQQ